MFLKWVKNVDVNGYFGVLGFFKVEMRIKILNFWFMKIFEWLKGFIIIIFRVYIKLVFESLNF